MTRLAVLDLDGTLVDSKEDLARAVNHALRAVGRPERSIDEVASFVGDGASNLVRRALGPEHEGLLAPALERRWEHYRAHLLDTTGLYPGLREAFRYRGGRYRVVLDGDEVRTNALLIAFANGREYGNRIRLAPGAKMDDGELEAIVVEDRSPLARLWSCRHL